MVSYCSCLDPLTNGVNIKCFIFVEFSSLTKGKLPINNLSCSTRRVVSVKSLHVGRAAT